MSQVIDLIKGALWKIRALGAIETPSAEISDMVLGELNRMLDTWAAEGLPVYVQTEVTKALTEGDNIYTIGSGGDIDTTKPAEIDIEASFIRDSSNNDYYLRPMTRSDYNRIGLKDSGDTIPNRLLYEQGGTLATITLYPFPQSGLTLYLAALNPFTTYSDIYDTVGLPPGYDEAIIYNLAMRMADNFGKVAAPSVVNAASQLKDRLTNRNFVKRPIVANVNDVPVDGRGDYDVRSDSYN